MKNQLFNISCNYDPLNYVGSGNFDRDILDYPNLYTYEGKGGKYYLEPGDFI